VSRYPAARQAVRKSQVGRSSTQYDRRVGQRRQNAVDPRKVVMSRFIPKNPVGEVLKRSERTLSEVDETLSGVRAVVDEILPRVEETLSRVEETVSDILPRVDEVVSRVDRVVGEVLPRVEEVIARVDAAVLETLPRMEAALERLEQAQAKT